MNRRVLGLTTSALILAYGSVGAIARDQMTPQPEQQQTDSQPMGHEEEGTTGQGNMMQGGMMGPGMKGWHQLMGGRDEGLLLVMLRISDVTGSSRCRSFRPLTCEFFKAMDANKDGKLAQEEIAAFFHGTARSVPQH